MNLPSATSTPRIAWPISFSIEAEADIGSFAQLVSDTAWTKQTQNTFSDQTDLLLDLNYDYELFPAFSATTEGTNSSTSFNQELRLISKHGGPVNWVLGGFYNRQHTARAGHETTLASMPITWRTKPLSGAIVPIIGNMRPSAPLPRRKRPSSAKPRSTSPINGRLPAAAATIAMISIPPVVRSCRC